jgi:NRPS condensation-like uncharacterized protein
MKLAILLHDSRSWATWLIIFCNLYSIVVTNEDDKPIVLLPYHNMHAHAKDLEHQQ